MFKNVSRRDAVLVLVGASCFYIFSAFLSVSQNPSIIINAHPEFPSAEQTITETIVSATTTTEYVSPTQAVPLDLGLVQNLPETSVVAHAPGWTIFRNLYMSRGALLLLTSDPSQFPEPRLMTSTGLPGNLTNDPQRIPTPREMAFITPEEARTKWGANMSNGRNRVLTVEGTTVSRLFYHVLHAQSWSSYCSTTPRNS
jgi:hypothetical protein